MQREVHAL